MSIQESEQTVPILARIWHEDDVWNVSAFDLPVVAYGESIEDARSNFKEATEAHFRALKDFGIFAETVRTLSAVVEERGFWENRVTSREMVQRFDIPALAVADICAVGV